MSSADQNAVGYPTNRDDPRYDLMFAIDRLEDAIPSYRKARMYYDGRVPEFYADQRIAELLEKSAVGYPFRLAAVPVDTLTERCRLSTIQVDEGVQDAWNEIYESNDMESWSHYQHFQTFQHGDAYLRILPAEEDEDKDVHLTYLSPFNTIVIYDNVDAKLARYALHRWQDNDTKRLYADLYYEGKVSHWVTRHKDSKGLSFQDWVPLHDENQDFSMPADVTAIPQVAEEPHGLDELPIKHSRTRLVYGTPVHEPGYGPVNAIMKHLITQLATIDTAGWPVRLLLGDPAATLDQANDNPGWTEEDSGDEVPAATASNTEGTVTSLREAPGVMHLLEGVSKVASFEAAEPGVFIEPVLKLYLPILAATTRTPLYAWDSTGEAPSGKSRQVKDAPLVAHVKELQVLLRDFWQEVARAALSVVDKTTKECQVGWVPVLLSSDLETWEVISLQLQNGVPFDVVMTQTAGFDPVTVAGWEAPPKPWEMEQQKMEAQFQHDKDMAAAGANVPGKSSDPRGQRGGANKKASQARTGTSSPKAQQGPSK